LNIANVSPYHECRSRLFHDRDIVRPVLRLGLLCVGSFVFLATLARANRVSAADLEWRSAIACDQRLRVVQEVERLIELPLADVDSADFTVTLRDLPDREIELQIETRPRNPAIDPSSRVLVGASCEEIAEAAALAIAMTVSSYQAQRSEAAPTPSARDEPVPVAVAKPDPEPVAFFAGAGAMLDVGAFPNAGIGAQIRLSLRYRRLSVVPLGVFFPRSTMEARSGAGAEFRSAAGGLLMCAGHALGTVRLEGCVGYELGRLTGRGTGLRQPRAGDMLWSAARAELQLGIPLLARLHLTASAGFTVPTVRKRFEIEGGLVHRPSAVTGRFGLGLEFRL
jgi:hypothetical protein